MIRPYRYAEALLDKSLSAIEYRIYSFLFFKCGLKDHCWPSKATIADTLKLHKETVRRAILTLQTAGYIRIEHRIFGSRQWSNNRYYLPSLAPCKPPAEEPAKVPILLKRKK